MPRAKALSEIARFPIDATHIADCTWDKFPAEAIDVVRAALGPVTAVLVIHEGEPPPAPAVRRPRIISRRH